MEDFVSDIIFQLAKYSSVDQSILTGLSSKFWMAWNHSFVPSSTSSGKVTSFFKIFSQVSYFIRSPSRLLSGSCRRGVPLACNSFSLFAVKIAFSMSPLFTSVVRFPLAPGTSTLSTPYLPALFTFYGTWKNNEVNNLKFKNNLIHSGELSS